MERLAALTMTLLMVAVSITSSLNVRNPPYEGQKYLIITIDTEAQSSRQSHDHVQRLIYGNFSEGRAGIIEMMDEAEDVGVQLTFFVDVLEDTLYPGEIREVLRTIHARGHDIQLHQHAYLIPDETWNEWQNEPHWHHHEADPLHKIDCWGEETADFVFEQMISVLEEENIPPPVASREAHMLTTKLFSIQWRSTILPRVTITNLNLHGLLQRRNTTDVQVVQWNC